MPRGTSAVQEDFAHVEKVHMTDWINAYGCVSLCCLEQWLWKSLAEVSPRSPFAYVVESHVTNVVSVRTKRFSLNGHIPKTRHHSPKGTKSWPY